MKAYKVLGGDIVALNDRQKRFVEEYLVDLNASQASIRAGYSQSGRHGYRMMQNQAVRKEIEKALAERSVRTGVNADRVVRELAKLAFVNIADVVNVEDGSVKDNVKEEDLACVQYVKVRKSGSSNNFSENREVKLYDKKSALEILGRHLGIFDDKLSISQDVKVVVCDDMGKGIREKG